MSSKPTSCSKPNPKRSKKLKNVSAVKPKKARTISYRCSPEKISQHVKFLSENQKDYVRKIGFGSLLLMPYFDLNRDLTLWLVDRFNCDTETLEFENGISIPVRPLVKNVLGIPSGLIKFVEDSDVKYDLYRQFTGLKSAYHFRCELITINEEETFCITFMMVILAFYLAPRKSFIVNKSFLGAAQQVGNLSQMDWSDFTASQLFKGIKEFKDSDASYVTIKGCLHILSVIFIDFVKHAAFKVPGGFPRLGFVTNEHNNWVVSHSFCSLMVCREEESVYASVAVTMLKDNIIRGGEYDHSDKNTEVGADQFGKTGNDSTCKSIHSMETHQCSPATGPHKEGPSTVQQACPNAKKDAPVSESKYPVSAELGTARSSPIMASLPIVEPLELNTSARSAVAAPNVFTESVSHQDTHTRHESLIFAPNADSMHHHSVEQEHANFPRDGQQLVSNGPSSEPYAAEITEAVQVAPDVSLGRNMASPWRMEGDQSAKKARVEQLSGHVEPAGGGAVVDTSLLNCPICSRPFKPPVFQCKGGHLACSTCLAELQCEKCEHGGAFDIHNMMVDTIVLSAKIKCSHDGCQSYVIYHELDGHKSTCRHAPCFCSEPGCSFVGLPRALLGHLTTLHSWPLHNIEYGKELRLQMLVSEPRHLLLAEEDDGMFLVVMGTFGQSTATAVSAVSLGACPALQRRYMLNIVAYLPPAVASRRAHMLLLDMEVESSSRPGEVEVEKLPSYLAVPPTYLVWAGASKEMSLDIQIDKIIS